MLLNNNRNDDSARDVYDRTDIVRRPICGIVSGYHDLPYIMVAPSLENGRRTVEITGRICVSPKFIISANMLPDTFGEIFDPDTFDKGIEGRIFSFPYFGERENVKIESKYFSLQHFDDPPNEYIERMADTLMRREDTRTGLIFNPDMRYYPVSIDKFISEIIDREFRV